MENPRRIAIIIGSDSDLPQCKKGFDKLFQAFDQGRIEVVEVVTGSIHRNTEFVLAKVRSWVGKVDIIIAGAGWANHLTGTIDAYLRYELQDNQIVVIGVAFEDKKNIFHTIAAVNSIVYVPGTQVVFDERRGEEGFFSACVVAIYSEIPIITTKTPKPPQERGFLEAYKLIREL